MRCLSRRRARTCFTIPFVLAFGLSVGLAVGQGQQPKESDEPASSQESKPEQRPDTRENKPESEMKARKGKSAKKSGAASTASDASTGASSSAASGSADSTAPRSGFPALVRTLKPRSIGPAIMGGRVSDIALDPQNAFTFYVALGTGGLMKTTDNGGSFQGIFEKEAVAAIGSVTVAPSDPKTIWVGTGEANDRNSSSWGNGVYLSTDGGGSWKNVGLAGSRVIARIVVDPKNPQTAYVAAMGDLWTRGGERGLYKTTDGGRTWKAILQAPAAFTDRVGCGEVVMDPSDSSVLYAALYARRRTPWSFSAGPAATENQDLGGIYKTTDAGSTWKKLGGGLPDLTGRIGIDVFRKNPKIVYATVQSFEGAEGANQDVRSRVGGIFRSDDAGASWTRTSPLNPRPFYFSQIRVDPENDQRVYVLGFQLHVSDDGGRSYREDLGQKVHPDCHAFAIDPRTPQRVLIGTDGGAYQSFDAGKSWEHMNRIAAGEFYRITLDGSTPYRVCGGLQDNNNWLGPSRTRTKEGILNSDWINIGGGDGFYCVFDPSDPDIVYAESQGGEIHRFDVANGDLKVLKPEPGEGQKTYRFHWNSPFIGSVTKAGSVHDSAPAGRESTGSEDRMYLAGNRVFELTEKGEHWRIISPDLSMQDPSKTGVAGSGAETYGVVYTLAESPARTGLLWAGTDDGKVWIRRNEGDSWTDLTENLPKSVRGEWISRIEPGHADAQVAYLAVDAHRSGRFEPLAFRTQDGGKSWQSIAGNLPADGPVKVVREDPKNPDLLYAGTEFGLFISMDRGASWTRVKELPTVAVDDLAVQARDKDLAIATHGRSLFILDDITPLEDMTAAIRDERAHLFPPRPALATNLLPGFADWTGKGIYRGENPPEGAILNIYVKEYTEDTIKIEITGPSPSKTPVANLTAPGAPGLTRLVWDLKPTKDVLNDYGGEGPRFVRPGDYDVALTYGKTTQTQKLHVDVVKGIETR